MILFLAITLCLIVSPLFASSDMPQLLFNTTYVVERSHQSNAFEVGGNLDETRFLWPNMPAKQNFFSKIRISNEGEQNVINPRVRINGFRIPLSSDELASIISNDSPSPIDRLLRTFYAMCDYSVHASPSNDARKPLSYFLYHSHGICDDQTSVQADLWQLFGYKWRHSGPYNHDSAEVNIGGKSFHLDANLKAFYLMYDNETIASAQDIHDDPMLVMRASHERVYDRFPRMPNDPEVNMYFSSEKYAALYGPGRLIEPFVLNKAEKKIVRIVLRPGESYGWNTGEQKIVNPFNGDSNIQIVARDVLWETRLNMQNKSHLWLLNEKADKAQVLNSRIVDLRKTLIKIPYNLPFPLLGIKIQLLANNSTGVSNGLDLNGKICIRIITPEKKMEDSVDLAKIIKGGYKLDHLIQGMSYPIREFWIEIDGRKLPFNNHENFSLSGIIVNLNCLSTIFAMRAPRSGVNTLIYTDDSSQRFIKINIEAHGKYVKFPRFPNDRFYPRSTAKIPDAKLQFSWPAAVDASVAGYHFQISSFPDMRYPLSPTFDRLIREDQMKVFDGMVRFRLPWHGMLPVQKKLYWRVRPYNNDLLAGDWSKIASFEVLGPGTPENINLSEHGGKIILSWKTAGYGTKPAYYEVHTSNLEGFMPVNKPHRLLGFSDRDSNKRCWHDVCATAWPVASSTFLASTRETNIVLLPMGRKNYKNSPGANYRVIAVDANGSRSCPSKQAFLRSPLIISPENVVLPAGKVNYKLHVISTFGRIYTKGNYDLGLWSKPQISFSHDKNLPTNWKIDKTTGVISGTLKVNEKVGMQITAMDQFGRKDTKNLLFNSVMK